MRTPLPPAVPVAGQAVRPHWSALRNRPGWAPHVDDLAALTDRRRSLLAGDTLVHSDLRDDNLILATDGTAWVCDWN